MIRQQIILGGWFGVNEVEVVAKADADREGVIVSVELPTNDFAASFEEKNIQTIKLTWDEIGDDFGVVNHAAVKLAEKIQELHGVA